MRNWYGLRPTAMLVAALGVVLVLPLQSRASSPQEPAPTTLLNAAAWYMRHNTVLGAWGDPDDTYVTSRHHLSGVLIDWSSASIAPRLFQESGPPCEPSWLGGSVQRENPNYQSERSLTINQKRERIITCHDVGPKAAGPKSQPTTKAVPKSITVKKICTNFMYDAPTDPACEFTMRAWLTHEGEQIALAADIAPPDIAATRTATFTNDVAAKTSTETFSYTRGAFSKTRFIKKVTITDRDVNGRAAISVAKAWY